MSATFEMIGPLSAALPAYEPVGRLGAVLRDMLDQSNGAAAFGGAFVLLPSGICDVCPTMEEVNGGEWKRSYPEWVREAWFFAIDAIGHPFGIHGDEIVQLDLETAERTVIGDGMGALLEAVEADPGLVIGLDLFEGWFADGGELDLRQRLAPKIPMFLGGGGAPDAFYASDLMAILEFNAYLYSQTKDVPDGGRIRLKVV